MILKVSKIGANVTTNETTLSRRGLTRYAINPFLGDASMNTNEGTKRRTLRSKDGAHLMVTNQAGEVLAPAGFWHTQEVDKTQFVKLYVNGVKAFAGLSGAGAQVFGFIYAELQNAIGKDSIYLNFADIDQSVTPISKATFMRGIKEVLLKKFLAETLVTGRYFVNPDYVFNGDRLAIVKEYRLKRDESSDAKFRERLEHAGQKRLVA